MTDRWKVYRRVAVGFMNTAVSFLVMAILMAVIIGATARYGGARVMLPVLEGGAIFVVLVFLLGEVVVSLYFRAAEPDPVTHRRFIDAVDELVAHRWMFRPRLRILDLDLPNAMAFGWGVLGQYAVGITQPLYDLLDDDELKAVLAHEIGHIRCWDVGIMGALMMLTGGAERLANIFSQGKTSLGRGPAALLIGVVFGFLARLVFPIGRAAVAQERELTADALAALDVGSPDPLVRALQKLESVMLAKKAEKQKERGGDEDEIDTPGVFDDLFISHPRMARRIRALETLRVSR